MSLYPALPHTDPQTASHHDSQECGGGLLQVECETISHPLGPSGFVIISKVHVGGHGDIAEEQKLGPGCQDMAMRECVDELFLMLPGWLPGMTH